MCLAQGLQHSEASEARTRNPSVSSQALYHWATVLPNYDVFLSLKVVLILVNSADPDDMQHYAAFHMGLHCLPKYPLRGFYYTEC